MPTDASHPTWDGACNLFDLGGVPLPDQRTTAHGKVFRSGSREFLTEQGWRDAARAGLTAVVDLRNAPREVGRRPFHPAVDDAAFASVTIHSTPIEDETDPVFQRRCGPWLDHPRYYADVLELYPERFAAAFRAIAAADGAVLVHCSAGRDRTGQVSAMLLALAGAAPQAIADGYERAVRGYAAYLDRHPEVAPDEPRYAAPELDTRIAERRATLVEWIDGLDVAKYLEAAGVQDDELARLRNLLVAAPPTLS